MSDKSIAIDGKAYAPDNLSSEARDQVFDPRVTDAGIERLKPQLAIAQTARGACAKALQGPLLAKTPAN